MEELKTHTENGFINLGKIKVKNKSHILDSTKKIYDLLLSLSYNSYKATIMSSLFSQLLKHIVKNDRNIDIQLGIQGVEVPCFFIQLLLPKEIDINTIDELNMVFDKVEAAINKYDVPYVLMEKQLVDPGVHINKDFITSTIKKIEIKSQEELFEKLVLSNKNLESSLNKTKEVNEELETFSYSVSHDLRAPLRHMMGFATLLKKHLASEKEDEKTVRFLGNIIESSKRMGRLIDDLLSFSRTGSASMVLKDINLNKIIKDVKSELSKETENRIIDWKIHNLPNAVGDYNLIRIVFQNLISNSIKYSSKKSSAEIEVGYTGNKMDDTVYYVRDNGAGFDMKYVDKLFGIFSRLHRTDEFEGTGIGLANVRRIITRHNGKIWAEAEKGKGATFYFTLQETN